MKKFVYVLAGIVLALSVVGCSSTKSVSSSSNSESEEIQSSESRDIREFMQSQDEQEIEEEEDFGGGYSEGRFGDTMETYFFDYTVNSAYLCDEYNGYLPLDGNRLLVSEVTVKNTFYESIEMYDTDFQVQWNTDGEDDYDFPITFYADPVSDEQLPAVYELAVNEEQTGLLVFEVPEGYKDFSISYLELFDDDSEGDVYFVYFTATEE